MSPHRSHFGGTRLAVLALMGVAGAGGALTSAGSFAAEPPKAAAPNGEKKVRLDFVQADINDVAKALSIQSGVNVVLMPSVKGSVTLRLTDVPLEDALRKMAAAVGSDVRNFDGTYFMGSTTELRAMVAKSGVMETLSLRYASPADVKELLGHAFPYLTVDVAGKSNLLVLSGTRDDVNSGVARARQMDIAPPEVAKPEPVKAEILREAYILKYMKGPVVVETVQKAFPDLRVNGVGQTVVVEGTKEEIAEVTRLMTALDTKESAAPDRVVRAYNLKYFHPLQVGPTLQRLFPTLTVSAGFESYSPAAAIFNPLSLDVSQAFNQQGLQGDTATTGGSGGGGGGGGGGGAGGGGGGGGGSVNLQGPGFRSRTVILAGPAADVEQATTVLTALDVPPQQVLIEARMVDMNIDKEKDLGLTYSWSNLQFNEIGPGTTPTGHTFAGSFARTPFNFTATLNALETNQQARVLARPNIAVVDGEQSSIFIGDILRFQSLAAVTSVGQTYTVETVPVGVALLCRPRVNSDGRITLRIHPTVSTVTSFTGVNNDIPQTSSREADTTIVVQDGETIALGGLIQENDVRTLTKVPFLGDLPVLGALFRNKQTTHTRTEVTIFITTKLLKT